MEYVPTEKKDGGAVPTIETLMATCVAHGVDRAALVRKPTEDAPVQLFVLLGSQRAVRDIGPGLKKIMESFPNPDGSDKFLLQFDSVSPISMLQEWMRIHAQSWRWVSIEQSSFITAVTLRGKEICERAAKLLNNNRCPCNLYK